MKHGIVLAAALLGLTGCVSGDPGYVGGPYRPVYDARPAVIYDARPPVVYRDPYRPRISSRDDRDYRGRRDYRDRSYRDDRYRDTRDRIDRDRRDRFRDDRRGFRPDDRRFERADPRFDRPSSPRYDARRASAVSPIARAERRDRPAAVDRTREGGAVAPAPPRGPRPYTPPRPAV